MNAAQSQGLSALSTALNSQQQNDRNMAYMQQLAANKKQDQAEQEQAQIAEQQYYQYLNEQADGLLAGDKEKINKRALKLQAAIKEQISAYGGDRRQFFQNGGHSLLGEYTNKIANSEEMTIFKENKTNLVRIMDAQQKGLGGQLMQKDLDALRHYNETGEGKITYGGLLTTLEMPDSENYRLGSEIPIDDIINHNSNRLKVLANFKMEHGRDPEPGRNGEPGELEAYASMRYGGKGSNRSHIEHAQRMAQLEAQKKQNGTTKATGKTKDSNLRITPMYQKVVSDMPKATVGELFDMDKNIWKSVDSEFARRVGLQGWNHSATRMLLDEKGWKTEGWNWFHEMVNPSVRLAHGGEMFGTAKNDVASIALGAQVDESGHVMLEPDASFYDMDGVQRSEGYELEPGVYNSKYKVLGISTAMRATNQDGRNQLIVEVLDDGKVDKDRTKEFAKDFENGEAVPTTVVALKHPDGHIFYKEVPLQSSEYASAIDDVLGSAGDATQVIDSAQQLKQIENTKRAMSQDEQQYLEGVVQNTTEILDRDPYFGLEVKEYTDPETGANRGDIMKGFYAAIHGVDGISAKGAAQSNMFNTIVHGTGQEAIDLFKNFNNGYSDKEVVMKWLSLANQNVTQRVAAENTRLAERWIHSLGTYHQLKQ